MKRRSDKKKREGARRRHAEGRRGIGRESIATRREDPHSAVEIPARLKRAIRMHVPV